MTNLEFPHGLLSRSAHELLNDTIRIEPVDSGHLVATEISLQRDFDVFSLLNHDREQWQIYWKAKQERSAVLALGAAMSIATQEPALAFERIRSLGLGGHRFYGGLPFDFRRADSQLWHSLGCTKFILPAVELRHDGDTCVMTLRALLQGSTNSRNVAEALTQALKANLSVAASAYSSPQKPKVLDEPDFLAWQEMTGEAAALIAEGRATKIVLSRTKTLDWTDQTREVGLPWLMAGLARIEEPSFHFCFVSPGRQAFLGRSPERLIRWCGRQYEVDALAGTRGRGVNPAEDEASGEELRSSRKEKHEHRVVTEDVQALLARHSDSVKVTHDEDLYKLRHVQHMVSRFSGQAIEGVSGEDLLVAMHPTPAVGGRPRDDAIDFISRREAVPRGWFAGAVGWTDGQDGDFAIGIRTALLSAKKLRLFAGAGIVEGSDPLQEWVETEAKMGNFLELFGL